MGAIIQECFFIERETGTAVVDPQYTMLSTGLYNRLFVDDLKHEYEVN